ncbi:MAG TPA: hypothetical protein VF534_21750 [Paraburkholderia sp.]
MLQLVSASAIVENPFAEYPYSLAALGLPSAHVVDGGLQHSEGASVRELLGLPDNWPQ